MIEVQLPSGESIRYSNYFKFWRPVSDEDAQKEIVKKALIKANEITAGYSYSPSHGTPGHYLALKVAKALEGSAILPIVLPKEGVMY